ncbi:MAG: helix-turn-helix domain-containing protein, partial [Pseudomonadota bacterium]
MDPDPETQRGGVEAVDRALVLLTCFQDGPASLGLAELAHRSGLNKSTILRICVSLLRRG